MGFYSPTAIQGGLGLGNVLARLARGIIPLFHNPTVQTGLRKIGKSVATAGLNAAQTSLENPNISFKQALREQGTKQLYKLKKEFQPSDIKRKKTRRLQSVAFQPQKKKQRDIFS